MRGFDSPDEVLFRWLEQRERLECGRGASLIAERGLGFAEKCPICKHKERDEKVDGPRSSWSCARCGTPWPVEIVFLMPHQFQRSKRHAGDIANAELATMTGLLCDLTLWQQRIYLFLFLYRRLSYRDCALHANRLWRSRKTWTERKARGIVYAGRDRIRSGIEEGDLTIEAV